MTLTSFAYCPRCDRRVEAVPMAAGQTVVEVCHRCENGMIYESREQWEADERDHYRELLSCDHDFDYDDPRAPDDRCVYCGLPESMEPEDAIDNRVDISDITEEDND